MRLIHLVKLRTGHILVPSYYHDLQFTGLGSDSCPDIYGKYGATAVKDGGQRRHQSCHHHCKHHTTGTCVSKIRGQGQGLKGQRQHQGCNHHY